MFSPHGALGAKERGEPDGAHRSQNDGDDHYGGLGGFLTEPLVPSAAGITSTSGFTRSTKMARLTALVRKPTIGDAEAEDSPYQASLIIRCSFLVNIVLFFTKLITFLATGSLAVLASLVDSTIDLVAQGILVGANYATSSGQSEKVKTIYPVGVSRVEPVAVMMCATLMVLAAAQVVQKSLATLKQYSGSETGPPMTFGPTSALFLSAVVLLKVGLWRWSAIEAQKLNNITLEAVALDNFNDVISNVGALLTAGLAKYRASFWASDPLGATVISLYIIWAWVNTAYDQMNMLVGKRASPDFLSTITEIAEMHDPHAQLDVVRAYHFGPKFLVEIEIVMDRNTPLEVSHDTGMLLQDRIEHLDEVERCFVHIDYQHRQEDDHDPSVPIVKKVNAKRLWTRLEEEGKLELPA